MNVDSCLADVFDGYSSVPNIGHLPGLNEVYREFIDWGSLRVQNQQLEE
tara:strand:+ start:422 stop:568 length:147 start_codon:yes stop_codon:yes gene_type:complete